MNEDHSKRGIGSPVVFALAVAVFGVLAMLIVDHGPWSKPHLQTAEMVDYPTTSAAAPIASSRCDGHADRAANPARTDRSRTEARPTSNSCIRSRHALASSFWPTQPSILLGQRLVLCESVNTSRSIGH
jgi:hypothetical protein